MVDTTLQTTIQLKDMFSSTLNTINRNIETTEKLIDKIGSTANGSAGLAGSAFNDIASFAMKAAGVLGITYLLSRVIDLNAALGRMDTMTNYDRTMTAILGSSELAGQSLEKLKQSVLGTAYGLDVAAKAVQGFVTRGMDIGNATNQVRILADAVSFYGDGTNEALSSTVNAWQNMYARGKVDMLRVNQLLQDGIPVVNIYAKAVNKSTAEVMDMISKGKLSSVDFISTVTKAMDEGTNGVIKSAGAAKEAGKTWATTFANMRAAASRGIISIIEAINEGLAAAGSGSIMDGLVSIGQKIEKTFNRIAQIITPIVKNIALAVRWIGNNMSWLLPTVLTLTAVFMRYKVALVLTTIATKIATAAKFLYVMVVSLFSRTAGEATAAQLKLNAAMLANPAGIIITAIVALIGILFIVIGVINHFKGTSYSAVGVIVGAFYWLWAVIKNVGLGIANWAIGIWNVMKACAENIKIAFNNAWATIQIKFGGFVSTVLSGIKKIIDWLNKIPGVNINTGNISNAITGFAQMKAQLESSKKGYTSLDTAYVTGARTFNYSNPGEAYGAGYRVGKGIEKGIKDKVGALTNLGSMETPGPMEDHLSNIDKNTGKAAKALEARVEEIKYIKDFAEARATRDMINNKGITIEFNGNTFELRSDTDIDDLANKIGTKLKEKLVMV